MNIEQINNTKPKWPEKLMLEIENSYFEKCAKYANTTDLEIQGELHRLRRSVVNGFAEKYPEVSFYHDDIVAKLDLLPRYPGRVITKITSQKEALQIAKYFGRREVSLIQTILGIISFTIIYGGGMIFLIYIMLHMP